MHATQLAHNSFCGSVGKDFVYYACGHEFKSRLNGCPGRLWTDFYDRSTRTIVGTMLWTEYRPVIKIGPKGSHEIRPIHSVPSLGQSKVLFIVYGKYKPF